MENIISAQDLVYAYPGEREAAVDRVSLTVRHGEMMAVLGHNGSGKSTFAKHLNAILLPQGGVCYVDGINTADENRLLDLRRTAGMVFQNPDNQIVATIVEEDVAFGLENLGVPPDEIRQRVDEALKEVGMYDYRLHAPHQLSGGQKQRIAIAGVIAMMPKLIILDEPTAMLDPRGREEVMETITRLNRDFGVTIILITHYMDEAAACQRVVVMDDGKVLLDDTPKVVFSHVSLLKQVGLDVPQATEIVYELRRSGIDLPKDIITDEECVEALSKLLSAAKGAKA
ncbi:MAG: cobalt transport protein ATP-binding subunit [Oscillospiraceae bacterium]|jgi:energy-coupling factor transport system ATP-binding protein|nr:cobalt transport protein ATP-binding subunit [Oscillospiraceae bacterium]